MYGTNIMRYRHSVKISNRERQRRATQAILDGKAALVTLLAVLAQCGGEKTVTQATFDEVAKRQNALDVKIEPSPKISGEFIVRLL